MAEQNRVDQAAEMPAAEMPEDTYSTYDLFILAISILSLVVLAIMVAPWSSEDTIRIAFTLDSVISLIFLFDFFRNLRRAPDREGYFKRAGWLDLLGSVPAVPVLRLFRLARVFRIIRTLRRIGMREVLRVYRSNLADSAFLTTLLVMILLLSISGLLIVRIESDGGYYHAKTVNIDSMVCTIGSCNMDIRSYSTNYEINAVIYDPEKAKELEADFLRDLEDCTEFDLTEYNSRSILSRFVDSAYRLASPLM